MSRVQEPAPAVIEDLLLSFGPFGVAVCQGPYGIFRWQRQNVFTIQLTNCRLIGIRRSRLRLRRSRGGEPFEISYQAIVSVRLLPHPSPIGLMKVLDIVYRDAGMVQERSIAAYSQFAERAFAILQAYAPGACGTPTEYLPS